MNKDYKKRDEIIRPYTTTAWGLDYCGGCLSFQDMPYEVLKELIDNDFVDLDSSHNEAPTIRELSAFLEQHKTFRANGYAVSIDRDDYRVSFDGLQGIIFWNSTELKEFIDFSLSHTPDDIRVHSDDYDPEMDYGTDGYNPYIYCYAWWD